MADETLLTLASDIISAHVSNNSVAPEDLPALITSVYNALAKLGGEAEAVEEAREPAVSIRTSVKPEAIACLECGNKMKMLKRHLSTDHGLTPAQYRERWSLNASYPMVAPEYAAKRKELAVKIGLGRKPKVNAEEGAPTVKAAGRPRKVTDAGVEASPKKTRGKAAKTAALPTEPVAE